MIVKTGRNTVSFSKTQSDANLERKRWRRKWLKLKLLTYYWSLRLRSLIFSSRKASWSSALSFQSSKKIHFRCNQDSLGMLGSKYRTIGADTREQLWGVLERCREDNLMGSFGPGGFCKDRPSRKLIELSSLLPKLWQNLDLLGPISMSQLKRLHMWT